MEEKHLESKAKICQPRRKTSEVERIYLESSDNTDKHSEKNVNGQFDNLRGKT